MTPKFHVGQRVRVNNGTGNPCHGCYADITAGHDQSGRYTLTVYGAQAFASALSGENPDRLVRYWPDAQLEAVRGRPYIHGIDPVRDNFGSGKKGKPQRVRVVGTATKTATESETMIPIGCDSCSEHYALPLSVVMSGDCDTNGECPACTATGWLWTAATGPAMDAAQNDETVEPETAVETPSKPVEARRERKSGPATSEATDAVKDALAKLAEALEGKGDGVAVDVDPEAVREVVVSVLGDTLPREVTSTVKRELAELLKGADPKAVATIKIAAAVATGNTILDKLAPFYSPGVDRGGLSVVLTSPPSFGKSHAARMLGKTYDAYFEHGCSDDMDEISTLLGSPVPDGHGGFIIVDGVLTQAMRMAQAGKNVLVLLDEIFRLSPRAQEWLLTTLVPHHSPSGRVYRMRTRKATADGLELIEAPAKHFHLMAASNLGMVTPVEAFWSRFHTVRIEFTIPLAESIGQSIADSYGVSGSAKLASAYARIIDASRTAVAGGALKYPADFRMLERACILAQTNGPDRTAKTVGQMIADGMADNTAQWNVDTGNSESTSVAAADGWIATLKRL